MQKELTEKTENLAVFLSKALTIFSLGSLIIILFGLVSIFVLPALSVSILKTGIILLLAVPLVSLLISLFYFYQKKRYKMVVICFALILMISLGIFFGKGR